MPDITDCRKDFPILNTKINDKPLVYLDNAATTQIPQQVLNAVVKHYVTANGNVHRGAHKLSRLSSAAYENAREYVKNYLGAQSSSEIIFTSGTSDGINLVASGLASQIGPGDEIIVSELEHHSNFVPWQQLCLKRKATFRIWPCPNGVADVNVLAQMLNTRTKVVAVIQVSNLTGTVMPLPEIIELAHKYGALVLVDGAQGLRHDIVDVNALDCDFYCFSGHKICAVTGTGVLYGKAHCLEKLDIVKFGGGMVDKVESQYATFTGLPARLEAGTPNYAGAISLHAALKYLEQLGRTHIAEHENELLLYTLEKLAGMQGIKILGQPAQRAGVLSFTVRGLHPFDIGNLLDGAGVAVRTGTHCAQPALRIFGESSAIRVSPAFYNTFNEIDIFCEQLQNSINILEKWAAK